MTLTVLNVLMQVTFDIKCTVNTLYMYITVGTHVLPGLHIYSAVLLSKNVKVAVEQATKPQRGNRCIALLFLQPRR